MQVSIGQAAANSLANYLRGQFASDVTVFDRWPEANVPLFNPDASGIVPRAVVSVVKMGRRTKSDAWGIWIAGQSIPVNGQTDITFVYGGIEQPMQIDVWAKTDDDRDDVVAQLDDSLYAGIPQTLNLPGDPVRDGILLRGMGRDGWSDVFIDYWFDTPEINDTPDSIQRAEYRATYFGEARTSEQQTQTVPTMTKLTAKIYGSASVAQASIATTATLTPNPTPPPNGKLTYGTST